MKIKELKINHLCYGILNRTDFALEDMNNITLLIDVSDTCEKDLTYFYVMFHQTVDAVQSYTRNTNDPLSSFSSG